MEATMTPSDEIATRYKYSFHSEHEMLQPLGVQPLMEAVRCFFPISFPQKLRHKRLKSKI